VTSTLLQQVRSDDTAVSYMSCFRKADVQLWSVFLFQNHEEKEPFGPGCRDYFWLLFHLIDGITKEDVELSWEQGSVLVRFEIDVDGVRSVLLMF